LNVLFWEVDIFINERRILMITLRLFVHIRIVCVKWGDWPSITTGEMFSEKPPRFWLPIETNKSPFSTTNQKKLYSFSFAKFYPNYSNCSF
jgi:hypothetical protein